MNKQPAEDWRRWKRLHGDFPLTVHPVGQWSKKVRGKVYYFGPLANPDAALRLWLGEKDFLLAGMPPPKTTNGLTIGGLLALHLADVDERVTAGKLSGKTRRDYLPLKLVFESASLANMPVDSMEPEHFAAVQRAIEATGRRLRTQKNVIMAIRAVLNWGHAMGKTKAPNYGPRFVAPTLADIEAEQDEAGVLRFFDREFILAALGAAKPQMKVAILFGINCGFYPGDSVAITMNRLHTEGDITYHDFRRVKTKRRRMAVLWPETIQAITEYRSGCRHCNEDDGRILLTQHGRPYTKVGEARNLIETFGRLADKVGERTKGVSLGSLRHTYATVVDAVPDQTMIDLTMGHTNKSIQKRTYRQMNLNELSRLEAISDVARDWLYAKGGGDGR